MLDAEPPKEINVRAVLLDTKGPEIRSGKLLKDMSGHETIHLVAGETITLHTTPQRKEEGSTESDLYIDYAKLHKSLTVGMKVLLDDGAIALTVTHVESDKDLHGTVTCTIENSGELRSRAGVNLPGAETDLPAMSEKDRVDIKYGMTKDVDFIAASFIQNAEAVLEIRKYIQDCAKELGWDKKAPLPLIISKIESMSALKHFDAILEASDGIMVARGDLGVEVRWRLRYEPGSFPVCYSYYKCCILVVIDVVFGCRFQSSKSQMLKKKCAPHAMPPVNLSLWRLKCWSPWPRTLGPHEPRLRM